jgi:hypothetical protein
LASLAAVGAKHACGFSGSEQDIDHGRRLVEGGEKPGGHDSVTQPGGTDLSAEGPKSRYLLPSYSGWRGIHYAVLFLKTLHRFLLSIGRARYPLVPNI